MKTKALVCLFNFLKVTTILCFSILLIYFCGNSELSQEKRTVKREVHGNGTCESDFLWSPDNKRCYKIKLPERNSQKYVGCSGNEVPIDFYNDKYKDINLSFGTRFWTDFKRVYAHGPFINWRVGDQHMGQPEFSLGVSNFSNGPEEKMCATVDIETLELIPTNCDLKFPRLCVLKPGQDPLQVLPELTVNFVKTIYNVMIFNTNLNVSIESDIICFTDNAIFPDRVKISRIISESEFEIKGKYDGYYWCLSANTGKYIPNESERILFISNSKVYETLLVIMVEQKEFYKRVGIKLKKDTTLYKYYCPDECGDSDDFQEFLKLPKKCFKDVIKKSPITHFYSDKIIFHGVQNDFLHNDQCNLNFLESRPILFCEPNGSIPRLNTGKTTIITNDIDECKLLKCEGDFYFGSYWNISDFSYNNCPSPEIQINDTINILERIILNGPVNESSLRVAVGEINKALRFKEVEIPSKVLQQLDTVLEQVYLLKDQVQIKVKKQNMEVIVAGSTDDVSIIGIKVNSSSPEFEDSSSHLLTAETIIDVNETNLIIVNVSTIMEAQPMAQLSVVHFRNDRAFQQTSGNIPQVNSRVVSVSIKNVSFIDEGQRRLHIDIYFRTLAGQRDDEKKECAYWDSNIGSTGEWSTKGCELFTNQLGALDMCRCYHLTHFAQILTTPSIPEEQYIALTIISLLGCSLSIIGLVIIALTAFLFRRWRNDFVHQIWINLSAAVGVMVILFTVVAEIDFKKSSDILCVGFGIALHYSVLSVFCWMLVAAMVYYQMVVNVFESRASDDRVRILTATLFGWLLPVIPVTLLLSLSYESYIQPNSRNFQHKFCYPSGMGLWLAVVLPAVLVVILNTFLFIHIMLAVRKSAKLKKHDKNKRQMFGNVKQLIVLFYQFGFIWIFGFFSTNLIVAYVFCSTATLQGLVLCYFFVIGNANTLNLWKDKIRLYKVAGFSILTDTSIVQYSHSKPGGQRFTETSSHKTVIEEDNVSIRAQASENRIKITLCR